MGFMDKVKEQAASAASAAKDAAAKGQAKVGEVQAKRGADGVLRQLGLRRLPPDAKSCPGLHGQRHREVHRTLKAYDQSTEKLSAEDSPARSSATP